MRDNQTRLAQPPVPPAAPPAAQFANQGQHAQTFYSVPTEFVRLPSRGMFYQEDHPLCGKEEVEIKYMTAKEEDILASEELLRSGHALDRLLQNLIVNPNIKASSLLVGDRNAIMLAARISAYGSDYVASSGCTECGQLTDSFEFNLQKGIENTNFIDQKFLRKHDLRFDEASRNFVVTLPKSQINVGFKMMTGESALIHDNIDPNSTVTQTLSRLLISVQGQTSAGDIRTFVDHMPAADSKFLRKLYIDLIPNIDLKQEFKCAHCGHVDIKEVPLDAGFFWPE